MAKDPVCGMMVDEKTAKLKSEHMGKTYYFCSSACKTAFDNTPSKFTKSEGHSDHSCCCGGH
jgi:Cu+-exporting ATPase